MSKSVMNLFQGRPSKPRDEEASKPVGKNVTETTRVEREVLRMNVSDTDKLVAATLAAAVIAIEKPTKPLEQVMTYEKILNVMSRRHEAAKAKAAKA